MEEILTSSTKTCFLTEMNWSGKVANDHTNMRVEFSWMNLLDAIHYNIYSFNNVKEYDHVFIIFPKGNTNLSLDASKILDTENRYSSIFSSNIVNILKNNNKKIYFIQEGPHWFFNDYSIIDQFNYYNQLQNCDILFVHNESDISFYRGIFPSKQIEVLPTVLIQSLIKDIKHTYENKVMIGGNFSRWYGGFQSYIISDIFNSKKYIQTSHSSRENENQIPDLHVLPRMFWLDWMKTLSTFKYAVHMMPTVAAGTFSLNCAYFGIPCIGNEKVDTQFKCFPELSVYSENIEEAKKIAEKLYTDKNFYNECSNYSMRKCKECFSEEKWKEKIFNLLKI
jgi:hypothetical protein